MSLHTLPNGQRLPGSAAEFINQTYKDIWNYVFEYMEGYPEFSGEDAGKVATAAALSAEKTLIELLAVDA